MELAGRLATSSAPTNAKAPKSVAAIRMNRNELPHTAPSNRSSAGVSHALTAGAIGVAAAGDGSEE